MNSLVREALQRLPRKSEWVFTKPNGRPYTAVLGLPVAKNNLIGSGSSELGLEG